MKKFIADLDQNSVYIGIKKVKKIKDGDIEVPEDCSLKPYMYKWENNTFIPVRDFKNKELNSMPLAEEALCRLIMSIEKAPAQSKEWAKSYILTFDGKSMFNQNNEELSNWARDFMLSEIKKYKENK